MAGVDITSDIIIRDATFTQGNGPSPGEFSLGVKDPLKTYAFRGGQPIEADFDGVPIYDGFVIRAGQSYFFDVDDTTVPADVERRWLLEGLDLNTLFERRILFDQSDPTKRIANYLAPGSSDLVWLDQIMSNLTIGGDNLTRIFQHVGTPNPDRIGLAISTADDWRKVMAVVARYTGAVWGIRPSTSGRFSGGAFNAAAFAQAGTPRHRILYYEDDDTITAPFAISDAPNDVTSYGYSNFRWLEDGSQLCNDARIWGVGFGQDHASYGHVSDATSILEHGRWPNPDGWRYDLWRQPSVDLVTYSLVYGSPQHLHGPKDPSINVKCRVRQPGLAAGQKVRIISSAFGEDIVLPLRKMKVTFVDLDTALFDLELTWNIDEPRTLFDRAPDPPGTDRRDPPPPEKHDPTPCEPYLFWTTDGDGGGWTMARSDPLLGYVSASAGGQNDGTVSFRNKRRYWQDAGFFHIGYGDGMDDSGEFLHLSKGLPDLNGPAYGYRFDFSIPGGLSQTPDFHHAPFPDYSDGPGLEHGAQSNVKQQRLSLDLFFPAANSDPNSTVGTFPIRLWAVKDGTISVSGNGSTGHAAGDVFHFELALDGSMRVWPHNDIRPTNANTFSGTLYGLPTKRVYPVVFPTRRIVMCFNLHGDVDEADTALMDPPGLPGPHMTLMERFLDAAVPHNRTPGFFSNSTYTLQMFTGVPSPLEDGYDAGMTVSNAFLVLAPFEDATLPNCDDVIPQPAPAGGYSQMLVRISEHEFATDHAFVAGSTRVEVNGLEQRLAIDYTEDGPHQRIIFTGAVPVGAAVFGSYQVLGSSSPATTVTSPPALPGDTIVGLTMGPWNEPVVAKSVVDYVTVATPNSGGEATNTDDYLAGGLDVVQVRAGPYGAGVSSINRSTWAADAVAAFNANPTMLAMEILNEPGGSWFWGSGAESSTNAAAYAALLQTVRSAFNANGSAPLLLASYDGGHPGGTTWGTMVHAADPNVWSYVDGVTVHPYGGNSDRAASALGNRASAASANAATGKPIWITEVGWPTATMQTATGDSYQWTEDQQANNIYDLVQWALSASFVAALFIFTYQDYGAKNWYGVTRTGGAHKKSFEDLRRAAHGLPQS